MKKFCKVLALLCVVAMMCTFFAACQQNKEEEPTMKFIFFNQMEWIKEQYTTETSHGDCTYVKLPNGESMLIDTSTVYSSTFIAERMEALGITSVDYLMVSHLHQDHVKGISAFVKKFGIKEVIWSGYGEGYKNAEDILRTTISLNGLKETLVYAGDTLEIGGATFEVLWPTKDAPTSDNPDVQKNLLNPYSLVVRIVYGDFSALFTGDIYTNEYALSKGLQGAGDTAIVAKWGDKLKSTMLKVPHHGLETSTSDAFVEAVYPQIAVVMGRGVHYLNSNDNVQIRFTKRLIPVFGTFSDGEITVETNGTTFTVTSEYKGVAEYTIN